MSYAFCQLQGSHAVPIYGTVICAETEEKIHYFWLSSVGRSHEGRLLKGVPPIHICSIPKEHSYFVQVAHIDFVMKPRDKELFIVHGISF